ncbi:MAG: hypothetical protein V1708_00780 [Candidatus Micrarchaeota archaeon]
MAIRLALSFAVAVLAANCIAASNIAALLPANVSALQASEFSEIEVLSLTYPSAGVIESAHFVAMGSASVHLITVSCSGPSQCACDARESGFSCQFSPPVKGTYSLLFSSENLSSIYFLELEPGKQVALTSVLESEPASNRLIFYAMAFLGIAFLAYLLYLAYRRLTGKKRGVRRLITRRIEIEHDMEALRYRYMKREIDEITLAQLMQQKKLELIALNAEISRMEAKSIKSILSRP